LHSPIRLFGERRSGCAGSSHDESREAVPIVQSILKIGIVTGITRFGTVPEVIVSIVLHSRKVLRRTVLETLCGLSAQCGRDAEVVAIEWFAVARHGPQASRQFVGNGYGGFVVSASAGDLQRPGVEAVEHAPLGREHPNPMACTAAGFHHHPQQRMIRLASRKRGAQQPLAFDDLALAVCKRQIEHIHCQIDRDGCSMHDGGLRWREPISSFKPKPHRGVCRVHALR
jgi:hypothetical protein